MQFDEAGKNLIKSYEGLRLKAYQDVAGVWTIGWGSTRYTDGSHVQEGDTLADEDAANALFDHTLLPYEAAVNELVKVPLSQGQFNALGDFAYNEGTGALGESTLLRKLNAGDYRGAADQFAVWNKVTDPATGQHVVNEDLVKRRAGERALFVADIAA